MGSLPCGPALRRLLLALLAVLAAMPAQAENLRLMTYNLLRYPGTTGNTREDDFRVVLTESQPDVLVVQELTSSPGATEFLNDVLNVVNPGQWALAPFNEGPDTNNACYYRPAKVDYQGTVVLSTALRDINGYFFEADGYGTAGAFRIYSMHLKAGDTGSDQNARLAEATILRNHLNALPAGTKIAIAGDMNLKDDDEGAWIKFTGSEADNDGRVFDPINRVGDWNANPAFADVHTQSPRVALLPDGGTTGGLDDRFDFILLNDDLLDTEGFDYDVGSYTCLGQDGNHFNQAVNAGTNTAVSAAVANALHDGSDHLPVFLDLELPALVPATMVVTGDLTFGTVITGAVAQENLTVQNAATPPADDLDYTVNSSTGAFTVPAGSFEVDAGNQDFVAVTMNTALLGPKSANITVIGDDPNNPSDLFAASGTVLGHAHPSISGSQVITVSVLFFGSHPQGEFSDQPVQVHNFNYVVDPYQAQLQAYDHSVTGADAGFFSIPEFAPALIGATPLTLQVHFNQAAVDSARLYVAILQVNTRDQPDLPGAANLSTLQWTLVATVTEVNTSVGGVPVVRTWLHANVPNPFNPMTTIAFDLRRDTATELDVFSARGRLVRKLVAGRLDAGAYRMVWDGRNDAGLLQASGVYFYRLRADGIEQTRRMTLVR